MAVRVKIDSIAKDLELIVSDMLSPEAHGAAIAEYAEREISDADETNKRILGRIPPRTVTVNGAVGARLESVRPGGSIVAEWEIVVDLLLWIANTLEQRSPKDVSGNYRRGHTIFADGVEISPGDPIPDGTTEFTFINLVPYARRLEVGKTTTGRDFLISVPNRIYERTYRDAKARFGNQARITFGYETQIGAYRLKNDQRSRSWDSKKKAWRYSKRQRPDRAAGSAVSVPAIRVSLKDY